MAVSINRIQATLDKKLATHGQIQPRIESFETKYKLTLPLNTLEKFLEFDDKIHENRECRTSFVSIDVSLV